jgi:hypothetical protein
MANYAVRDKDGNAVYLAGQGAGTEDDPLILTRILTAESLPLPTGAATEDTLVSVDDSLVSADASLASIDSKMPMSPATSGKQDTGNTSLASILAKLSADPATQTTLAAILAKLSSDPATQTTLAAVLAKLTSDPATETKLEAVRALLATISGNVDGLEGFTDGLEALHGTTNTLLAAATPAGENHVGAVGGHTARVSASFTRPSDTNVYASGDLVANNTVANSVTPMTFAIGRDALGKGGMIRRVRLRKSGTSITNASFRLHLYSSAPTQAGGAGANTGDNAAWSTNGVSNYVGGLDITVDKAFTDGAAGNGSPVVGSEINFTADTYYGVLEAKAAYVPASGETIEILLEILQN